MLLYTGHRTRHTPFCRQLCVPPSAEESRASTGKDFMLSEAEVSRGHYPCCLTSGGERYNLVPGTMQWLTLQLLSSGHREALSRSWKEQQRAEGKCGGVWGNRKEERHSWWTKKQCREYGKRDQAMGSSVDWIVSPWKICWGPHPWYLWSWPFLEIRPLHI